MVEPISAGEIWARLPVVDRDTRNLSLTRCGAVVALWCWCDVAAHSHTFTAWSCVVLAIIAVMMLAKSIADLKQGFGAVGRILRRSTDSRPAIPDYEPTTIAREGE